MLGSRHTGKDPRTTSLGMFMRNRDPNLDNMNTLMRLQHRTVTTKRLCRSLRQIASLRRLIPGTHSRCLRQAIRCRPMSRRIAIVRRHSHRINSNKPLIGDLATMARPHLLSHTVMGIPRCTIRHDIEL